jgi:hypothetical protein
VKIEAPEKDTKHELALPPNLPSPLPILGHLLRLADDHRAKGETHQAAEMYFELADRNNETPEGWEARGRLVEIGEEYERDGKAHQARSIYERLGEPTDPEDPR